jgi:hypothetical protein
LEEKTLVLSHLIPQAVYDYCRTKEASPVRVGDGVIMHTDRQLMAYLLCAACEDILNKGGESWVNPRLATLEKHFPLYDLLMNAQPGFKDENGGIYYAATNPDFLVEKLTHFALGIFWKASVHSWSGSKKEPMIELGAYADTIRTWLRGETAFPEDVSLTVTLSKPDTAFIVLQQPVETKTKPWRIFLFYVPGVLLSLNVGETIETDMRMICFHQSPTHPVFVSSEIMGVYNARLGKDYVGSRKTKSYLRQRAKRRKDRTGDTKPGSHRT